MSTTPTKLEDKTAEKKDERYLLIVFPALALGAASFFENSHNWQGGIAWGLALGLLLHGVPVTRSKEDKHFKERSWGRPLWLRLVALVATGVGSYFGLEGPHTSYGLWAALAFPLLFLVFTLWGRWGSLQNGLLGRLRPPKKVTQEEAALEAFNPAVLRDANLASYSHLDRSELLPEIISKALNKHGEPEVRLRLVPGLTLRAMERAEEGLAIAWRVPRVTVTEGPLEKDGSHTVILEGHFKESVLPKVIPWKPAPVEGKSITAYVKNLPMGYNVATAEPWSASIASCHYFITGKSGSGKSSFNNTLLRHLARHPDVRIAYVDLKRGIEAAQWAGAINATFDNGGPTVEDQARAFATCRAFIDAACTDVAVRYNSMIEEKAGTDAWNQGYLGSKHPAKILVIDECSELFKVSEHNTAQDVARTTSQLGTFIQQGRAAGYVLVMMTQYASNQHIPTVLRENFTDRVLFNSSDLNAVHVFGSDWNMNRGYKPSGLPKGTALVHNEDLQCEPIKFLFWQEANAEAAQELLESESAVKGKPWLDDEPLQRQLEQGILPGMPKTTREAREATEAELDEKITDALSRGRKIPKEVAWTF